MKASNRYDEYEMQWQGDFNPRMVRIGRALGNKRSRMLITPDAVPIRINPSKGTRYLNPEPSSPPDFKMEDCGFIRACSGTLPSQKRLIFRHFSPFFSYVAPAMRLQKRKN
jgi:hypothetical protein